jgi:thiamine pyrophosphokinase
MKRCFTHLINTPTLCDRYQPQRRHTSTYFFLLLQQLLLLLVLYSPASQSLLFSSKLQHRTFNRRHLRHSRAFCLEQQQQQRKSFDLDPTSTSLECTTVTTTTTDMNEVVVNDTDDVAEVLPTLHHKSPLLELYESNLRSSTSTTVSQHRSDTTALIVLNAPIGLYHPNNSNNGSCCSDPPITAVPVVVSPLFQQLWDTATYRVCADGGANRLYTLSQHDRTHRRRHRRHDQNQQKNNSTMNHHSISTTTTSTTSSNTVTSSSTSMGKGTEERVVVQDDETDEAIEEAEDNDEDRYIPDCITGDLDSILSTTRQYYTNRGVSIVHVPDQNSNDLDKAIVAVIDHFQRTASSTTQNDISATPGCTIRCVVYGAFGGRFDQEMASFQSLYRYNGSHIKLFLYDDHTMAFLLPSGYVNTIQLYIPPATATETATATANATNNNNNNNEDHDPHPHAQDTTATDNTIATNAISHITSEGPTCGLIPLGCPVDSVTTTGLQWNLHEQSTSFGTLVSTSNRIVMPPKTITPTTVDPTSSPVVVTVICSQPIVFTAQVHAGITTSWSE